MPWGTNITPTVRPACASHRKSLRRYWVIQPEIGKNADTFIELPFGGMLATIPWYFFSLLQPFMRSSFRS